LAHQAASVDSRRGRLVQKSPAQASQQAKEARPRYRGLWYTFTQAAMKMPAISNTQATTRLARFAPASTVVSMPVDGSSSVGRDLVEAALGS
jgi:hypothetical protein